MPRPPAPHGRSKLGPGETGVFALELCDLAIIAVPGEYRARIGTSASSKAFEPFGKSDSGNPRMHRSAWVDLKVVAHAGNQAILGTRKKKNAEMWQSYVSVVKCGIANFSMRYDRMLWMTM